MSGINPSERCYYLEGYTCLPDALQAKGRVISISMRDFMRDLLSKFPHKTTPNHITHKVNPYISTALSAIIGVTKTEQLPSNP